MKTPFTRPAAVEEGIVPGGGVALVRAIASLGDELSFDDDRQYGVNIIKRAGEEPLRQIATNAGLDGSIVVEAVKGARAPTVSTLPPRPTRTWLLRVSSTRPRSFGRLCKTRLRWLA